MLWLRTLLKHPQLHGSLASEVYQLVKQARVFVVDPRTVINKDNSIKIGISDVADLPLALPFKTCWFEMASTAAKSAHLIIDLKDGSKIASAGVLAHETSPDTLSIYALELHNDRDNGSQPKTVSFVAYHNVPLQQLAFDSSDTSGIHQGMVRVWLDSLRRYETATETTSDVLFIPKGSSKKKKPHPIRQIIRILPKRESVAAITSGGVVDWTHRWEVRGHWRLVDGIGKDREGVYCVSGFTWVSPFLKGPEGLPFIQKTRVVTQG